MASESIVIPVASGKGGTGKSMFTANLSIALAELNHSVITIDLDLGGSNLYSFLGLKNEFPGIGDFLMAKKASLENLLIETGLSNLKFLPGDVQSPFMANIPYFQKLRLINHIKKLKADYIIIDLGSGSSFNTLDLFGVSRKGILLTTFEHTALINMLTFLKNFIFRTIGQKILKDKNDRKKLREVYTQTDITGDITTKSLLDKVSGINPEASSKIEKFLGLFRPRIIFNMGYHPDDLKVIKSINKSIEQILSIQVDYYGFIRHDDLVPKSVRSHTPLIQQRLKCAAANDIQLIADRIDRLWNEDLKNTGEILQKKTKLLYEN